MYRHNENGTSKRSRNSGYQSLVKLATIALERERERERPRNVPSFVRVLLKLITVHKVDSAADHFYRVREQRGLTASNKKKEEKPSEYCWYYRNVISYYKNWRIWCFFREPQENCDADIPSVFDSVH